jgi:hypothetical protein
MHDIANIFIGLVVRLDLRRSSDSGSDTYPTQGLFSIPEPFDD